MILMEFMAPCLFNLPPLMGPSNQEEIEIITMQFWKNIMRKRTIDTDKLQTILDDLSKKMNIESQMQLGLE